MFGGGVVVLWMVWGSDGYAHAQREPVALGVNLQRAAQLAAPLSHAAKTHAGAAAFPEFFDGFWCHAASFVQYVKFYAISPLSEFDESGRAIRMAMNVCQRFLDDAEQGELVKRRQRAQIRSEFKSDVDAATL